MADLESVKVKDVMGDHLIPGGRYVFLGEKDCSANNEK